MKNHALLFTLMILITISCKDKITKTETQTITTPGLCTSPQTPALQPSPIKFTGISSITDITNNSVTVNWPNTVDVSTYQIALLDKSNSDIIKGTKIIKTVMAPQTSAVITNLDADREYSFYVRAMDTNGLLETNYNILTVRTKLLPPYSNLTAINFSGSQSLSLKKSSEYFKTGKISASLWLRTTHTPSNDTRLITFHKGANASTALSLGVRDSKLIIHYTNQLRKLKKVSINLNYANNQWNHLALTYNNRFLTLYYNAVEIFTLETTLTSFGEHKAHIGAFTGIQRGFYGALDEVAIYSSALSSKNIDNIYNNGMSQDLRENGRFSSLTSWFRMGDDKSDDTSVIIDQVQAWNAFPLGIRKSDFINR